MSAGPAERSDNQAASPAAASPVLSPAPVTPSFEPVILGFTCNWCSYRAADLAGTARLKYPPNIRLIRLMCSGSIDPTYVLRALADGADGVMITGCHPGECHYIDQNLNALRRYLLLRRVLEPLGIDPARVRLVWASAAEGAALAAEITRFTEEVRALGPLGWPTADQPAIGEPELTSLAAELASREPPDLGIPPLKSPPIDKSESGARPA